MPKTHATIFERFWAKVRIKGPNECWFWTGGNGGDGYGVFAIDRKPMRAHRAAWLLHRGPVVAGQCVCHTCDNRKCVNLKHLWVGSVIENNVDRHRKGRSRGASLPGPLHPAWGKPHPRRGCSYPLTMHATEKAMKL